MSKGSCHPSAYRTSWSLEGDPVILDEEPGILHPIFTWKEPPLTAAQRAWMVPGLPPHARAFAKPQQNVPTSPTFSWCPSFFTGILQSGVGKGGCHGVDGTVVHCTPLYM